MELGCAHKRSVVIVLCSSVSLVRKTVSPGLKVHQRWALGWTTSAVLLISSSNRHSFCKTGLLLSSILQMRKLRLRDSLNLLLIQSHPSCGNNVTDAKVSVILTVK